MCSLGEEMRSLRWSTGRSTTLRGNTFLLLHLESWSRRRTVPLDRGVFDHAPTSTKPKSDYYSWWKGARDRRVRSVDPYKVRRSGPHVGSVTDRVVDAQLSRDGSAKKNPSGLVALD